MRLDSMYRDDTDVPIAYKIHFTTLLCSIYQRYSDRYHMKFSKYIIMYALRMYCLPKLTFLLQES